ncbi:ribonuclease H-like domain-containing protein [Candidatus Kaiserbacteria bacterium]|nr:ribonuclease H-like domain-containing protein [Candidatus Kaiserbacteria bacterium]
MRTVVFDIETANWMGEGRSEPSHLDIAIVGIHDSATDSYGCFVESELPSLWKILEATDILVGYNSDHFDIPLLNKYYPGDLGKLKSVDLMAEIYKNVGRRIRLDAVAEGTLGKKKSGGGGQSLVWWRNGEIERVKEYCKRDVELTKELYEYALKNGGLKYRELGTLHEIKLDTSKWLTPNDNAMTFSLGF